MSKHTPGPWHPVEYCGYWALQREPFYNDKDDLLNEEDYDVAAYNARLAAAAPEMYEILKRAQVLLLSREREEIGIDDLLNRINNV